MSYSEPTNGLDHTDTAPGDQRLDGAEIAEGVKSYLIGLGLATLLTIVSFVISSATFVWPPSIPVALVVLAIAQMGVHLVFFFHITTGPDNVNNVMALAFGVLIVLLILTGSLWIMGHLSDNMAPMDQTMETQPKRGSMAGAVTANGVVGPATTALVGARADGVIEALDCAVKTHVKAGQLCAKIDPRPYQIIVDQRRAELDAAETRFKKDEAALSSAKTALESHEGPAQRSGISRRKIDRLRKAFESAQARIKGGETKVAELQASLHAAETALGYTDIVAPIDGTVTARNAEKGQTVAADTETAPLFVIAEDLTLAQIKGVITARDGGEVKLGAKATFTVAAFPNRSFSGVVTQIRPSPQINGPAGTYDVVISAPNPDLLLEPGMTGMFEIAIE